MVSDVRRPDFNQSLVHLTRERVERSQPEAVTRVVQPFDVLKEIIASGILRASGNEGFVKGTRRAVCLSEIPLSVVHYFANSPFENNEKRKYGFYGLAFSKRSSSNFAYAGRTARRLTCRSPFLNGILFVMAKCAISVNRQFA
jgi:hypothetical protein